MCFFEQGWVQIAATICKCSVVAFVLVSDLFPRPQCQRNSCKFLRAAPERASRRTNWILQCRGPKRKMRQARKDFTVDCVLKGRSHCVTALCSTLLHLCIVDCKAHQSPCHILVADSVALCSFFSALRRRHGQSKKSGEVFLYMQLK